MADIIRRLPIDIVQRIIPYTYELQNMILLRDIENYGKTKETIGRLYYYYWSPYYFPNDKEPDREQLLRDICKYANNGIRMHYGYMNHFYNICFRSFQINTEADVFEFMDRLQYSSIDSQINFFWGIFTPAERERFIYRRQKKMR